jgi:hypothetical protein
MAALSALCPAFAGDTTQVAASGQVNRNGANAGGRSTNRNRPAPEPSLAERLPDFVYGGNALSLQMPLQFGLASYLPRARIGLQYDYQLMGQHWAYGQVSGLFDRGNWDTFRLDDCGLEDVAGACGKGRVAGFELAGGYAYKFYLEEMPYLVPYAHAGLGWGLWGYPKIGGGREQDRVRSSTLHIRAGGGARFFLLRYLGIGVDLNLKVGASRHLDAPLQNGAQKAERVKSFSFLLGLEVLPLIAEIRF